MSTSRTIALPAWLMVVLALVGGCASERHHDIPSDARLVSEGNRILSYQFEQPGTVYIYDRDTERMVYSGKVERGDAVRVDPEKNRITLNDRIVRDEDLRSNDTRRIFFELSADH